MELEDLKQTWKQAEKQTTKNTDIMEMIQQQSYGPVSALKRSFRRQFILMIVMPLIIMIEFDPNTKLFSSIIFWAYLVFCLGMATFFYANYKTAQQMENMDGMVKPTLEKKVSLLESRLRLHKTGIRLALLFFVLLIETVPYLQHYSMLDKWHALSRFTRFGAYAGFFVLQYLVSTNVNRRKFGQHLEYLRSLLNKMNG